MRTLKTLPLVSALVLIAGPLAAQQAVAAEPATTPPPAPTATAPAPAPKSSSLYESNTPKAGTIAEAKEANASVDGNKKHTLVLTTLAIVVIVALVIIIF